MHKLLSAFSTNSFEILTQEKESWDNDKVTIHPVHDHTLPTDDELEGCKCSGVHIEKIIMTFDLNIFVVI